MGGARPFRRRARRGYSRRRAPVNGRSERRDGRRAFDFGAFGKLGVTAAVLWIFSLMLSDFFDTMGTLVGVGHFIFPYLQAKGWV